MVDVLLIREKSERNIKLSSELSAVFWVESVELHEVEHGFQKSDCVYLIDCNIVSRQTVLKLKDIIKKTKSAGKSLFLIDGLDTLQAVQSDALGGSRVASKAMPTQKLVGVLSQMLRELRRDQGAGAPADIRHVLDYAELIFRGLPATIQADKRLPKKSIQAVADKITAVLDLHGLKPWLEAVTSYRSAFFRHVMRATGLAIAYGKHLHLAGEDMELLTTTALLYDIGTVRLPRSILDKQGMLSPDELDLVRRHPAHGGEILERDGGFHPLVAEAARHHHEFLDGSGYPNAISATRIPYLVRLITVVDVYAELIDNRTNDRTLAPHQAYQAMREMEAKLDGRLVNHFRPVILSEGLVAVRRPKPRDGAGSALTLSVNRSPLDRRAVAAA